MTLESELFAKRVHERVMRLPDLTIGGKTPPELEKTLDSSRFRVSIGARTLLRSQDFTTLPSPRTIRLAKIRVSELGFNNFNQGPILDEIYKKAQEAGLVLCPAEAAPYLRLAEKSQPLGESLKIAMNPIASTEYDEPSIFVVNSRDGGLWLESESVVSFIEYDIRFNLKFDPRTVFVFALNK
jgi:hypothetical protein